MCWSLNGGGKGVGERSQGPESSGKCLPWDPLHRLPEVECRCQAGLGGRKILTMELTPEGGVPTCPTEASPLRCDAHSQGPTRGPSLESEENRRHSTTPKVASLEQSLPLPPAKAPLKKKTGDETHLLLCFINELNPGSLYDLFVKCVSILS